MDFLKARLERVKFSGTQGAAEKIQAVFTCEIDEVAVCTNLCFQNGDAANTINVKLGVSKGGTFFAAQATAALGAGLYKQLDNPIYLRERDILQAVFTPSGANTEWEVWAEIHVFMVEHTIT